MLRAAGRDRRSRPDLCLLRPRHTGPRPARARRLRLPNSIDHARRSLSPDLSPGNSGPVAPRLIGLRARTAFQFQTQWKPTPPTSGKSLARPAAGPALSRGLALCRRDCGRSGSLAAAQPGACSARSGGRASAAWRPSAPSASPGCRWPRCGFCWAHGAPGWSRTRLRLPRWRRSRTVCSAPSKEPSSMPDRCAARWSRTWTSLSPASNRPSLRSELICASPAWRWSPMRRTRRHRSRAGCG